MKQVVSYTSLVAMVVLAVLGKSAVMVVSVLGMGLMYWRAQSADRSKLLLAVVSGALLASLGAETVHTIYHLLDAQPSATGSDNGFLFVSATLVGLINAAAFCTILLVTEWLLKWRASKSHG